MFPLESFILRIDDADKSYEEEIKKCMQANSERMFNYFEDGRKYCFTNLLSIVIQEFWNDSRCCIYESVGPFNL